MKMRDAYRWIAEYQRYVSYASAAPRGRDNSKKRDAVEAGAGTGCMIMQ